MATVALTAPVRPAADQVIIVKAVTVIMRTVVGLTFTFGFGNVLTLALRLGVPVWVAPLVAPAVDPSILGLLLGSGTSPCTALPRSSCGQRGDCSPRSSSS